MLVFSEGVPRSGKSYDAVKSHILPALKMGRTVFARLNGLNHERIAVYLGLDPADVRARLIHVPTDQVRELFVAQQDEAGEWHVAESMRNALVVIDEVHEFYLGGTREQLPMASEQFFALHGHYGIDVLCMTQSYKRVHPALRARIERKNVFQKLSALGKKGEGMYRETVYQTIAPDKYEKVGGSTAKYDKAIWPLYHGIKDGGDSGVTQAVYEGGKLTVWRSMLFRAAFIIPIGIFSIWFLFHFFAGGANSLVKDPSKLRIGAPQSVAYVARPGDEGEPIPGYVAPAGEPGVVPVKPEPPTSAQIKAAKLAKLTPEQQYIWALADKGRIRLAAQVGIGESARAIVEWVDAGGITLERLSLLQLRDMGIKTEVHAYGVRLAANDEALIATGWPLNVPIRNERPELYNTAGARRRAVSGSEPHDAAPEPGEGAGSSNDGVIAGSPLVASYGDIRRPTVEANADTTR